MAYDSLLTARREALHEAAGRALEELYAGRLEEVLRPPRPPLLAHRQEREGGRVPDRFAAARRAHLCPRRGDARRCGRPWSTSSACPSADRGIAAPSSSVLRLVNSLYFLGRFGESLDLLLHQEPIVARIDDPDISGPFHMWLGHTYTHAGDSEGAARAISRAMSVAEASGDLATIGKAHYVLAREGFWLGSLAEGAESGRAAVAALRDTDDWWWLAHSHCWTALNLCNLGRFDEALAEVAEAERIGEKRGDPRIHSYAHWNRCWFLATRGDWEAAIAAGRESLQTSPDTLNSSYSMGWLGFAYREKGDHGRGGSLPGGIDRAADRVPILAPRGLVQGLAERGPPAAGRRRPEPSRRPIRDCAWPASCATPGASPRSACPREDRTRSGRVRGGGEPSRRGPRRP